jgi:hypothetical protein
MPRAMCAWTSVPKMWPHHRSDRLAQLCAVRGGKLAGPLEGAGAHLVGHHAKENLNGNSND